MGVNVVLVGMPASGKTTVGGLLAGRMPEYTFVDTDTYIEKIQGMKIYEIFDKYSEDYFRKLENEAIRVICVGDNKVVSVGGGAFENPDNRARLLRFGRVFYLKSDLDVLYYRVSGGTDRPLLKTENPKGVLERLLRRREENFQKAHYVVDTSELSPEEVAGVILESIRENSGTNG